MNKTMLPRLLWQRVRVWPLPGRVRIDGLVLPREDDDWIPEGFDAREGVRLMNVRTGHAVLLDFADIHQYDSEAASTGAAHLERLQSVQTAAADLSAALAQDSLKWRSS